MDGLPKKFIIKVESCHNECEWNYDCGICIDAILDNWFEASYGIYEHPAVSIISDGRRLDRTDIMSRIDDFIPTALCECCGADGAKLQVDPYAYEIHGDDTEKMLCDICCVKLADDI